MNFLSFKHVIAFLFLCSSIAAPNLVLRADDMQIKTQDCVKAKQIAQRVYGFFRTFLFSKDPKHIANAQIYLNNIKPSGKIIKKLLDRIRTSIAKLLAKMRQQKNLAQMRGHLINAFNKFGNEIKNAAYEIKTISNDPETLELASMLEGMPDMIQKQFDGMGPRDQAALGLKIKRGRF